VTTTSAAVEERWIGSSHDPRARIFVRARGPRGATPLVLVHGFFQPASAILDVSGWSLQEALAAAGLRVVLFDLRGYGRSSRPGFMDRPPQESSPALGCLADAVADIGDVVQHVCETEDCAQVDVLGYSWGTARSAAYALGHPQRVRRLVLYAPVWCPRNGAAAEAASPGDPSRLDVRLGGYRAFGPGDLSRQWDAEIGPQDPRVFRDPRVVAAAEEALFASDTALAGGGYRAPLGPMLDALGVAQGQPLFDAAGLRGNTLLVRGDCDQLSVADDAAGLFAQMRTPDRRLVTIAQGTHLLHLEHARWQLIDEIVGFLGAARRPVPRAVTA
jgi:pimeloyl-ACP methyl ester carboxylesterase